MHIGQFLKEKLQKLNKIPSPPFMPRFVLKILFIYLNIQNMIRINKNISLMDVQHN